MRNLLSSTKLSRLAAIYLMVAVFFAGTPISVSAAIGADITANGAHGTVTIADGDSFTYEWSSTDATACTLTSPSGDSGIATSGNGGPIDPGHPWYPSVGSPTTLTIHCTDGTDTSTGDVVIEVTPPPAPQADIKAEGSDGPVTITDGDSWNYTWNSDHVTACTLTSPSGDSGISLSGSGGPIDPGHPWYPAVGSSTTLVLNCTDGTDTANDSVTINVVAAPPPPPATVTADIKANGSDGPVTITEGADYSYSWTSSNATACTLTSPSGDSGISTTGNGGPITTGHPWYPTIGGPVTLTLNCTNGTNTATDSVVINLTPVGGAVTADIKANGSDGPVTINNGTDYDYSWTSTGATACTLTAPNGVSGISVSGNGGPISPGHPWYPGLSSPVTLTLDCTDGTNTATDSVVINVTDVPVVVTADIKANGSDGPVTITNSTSWNYSWTSGNATACTLTSPSGDSGIAVNGSGGPIDPGHPWYPAVGSSTTLTLNCTNGGSTATDSVVINVVDTPPPGGCDVSLAITSEGSVSVRINNSFSYTITSSVSGSTATTTYSISGTLPAGVSFDSSTATISGTPTEKGTFSINLSAVNDCANASKSLTISVTSGGGGGGGHSGGGGGSSTPTPEAQSLDGFCPYLTSYLRYGVANDTMQVIKLQAFLKVYEHFDYVTINGTFDEATLQAVNEFQVRYQNEILTPWGINAPTGYVYKLTLAKINQILCGTGMPTVHAPAPIVSKEGGSKEGSGGGLATAVPVVGNNVSNGHPTKDMSDSLWTRIAAAIFSLPHNAVETLQTIYELILILIVLYILASVLEAVLYKDVPENVSKRFYTKYATMLVGLLLAAWGAYVLKEWPLILPLILVFFALLAWLLLRDKQAKIITVIKSYRGKRGETVLTKEETILMPGKTEEKTIVTVEKKD